MTLGIAARTSTTNETGVPTFGGVISEINAAIPKLTGTAIVIAMAELAKVPRMYGSAPKDSRPSTGFQSVPVKNFSPSLERIGIDPWVTQITTSVSMRRV